MNTYDEITHELIENPDLENGYVYPGTIVVGQTEPHYEVMERTVTKDRPEGLRKFYPAQDIVEDCQYYHKCTDEEKKASEMEKRVKELEDELAATKILLGVE